MNDLGYFAPTTVDEALELLSTVEGDARLLAGGTDLLILMRRKRVLPDSIVDLTKVNELNYIKDEGGYIKIGSMTTFTQLERSPLINEKARVLAQACREVGSPLIRHRGTIGGNIATASPAADSVPALIALGSTVVLESVRGIRELGLEEVLCGVNKNRVEKDEILTQIYFPISGENASSAFRKLGKRAALSISRLSVAVAIEKDDEKICKDIKIALGSVAKNPFRAIKAEEVLRNQKLSPELLECCVQTISDIAAETIGNRPSAPFKRESIKGVSREVLTSLYQEMGFAE